MGKLLISCPCCNAEIIITVKTSVDKVVECQPSLFKKEAIYQPHHGEYVRDSWPHAIH